MNLIDVAKQFATEEACLDYLENMRWPDGVTCLKCGGNRTSKIVAKGRERTSKKTGAVKRSPTRYLYECLDPKCGHQFTATTGTIFHDTHLPLEKWFLAVALMVNAKKGLSAKQLQRDLGIAYKTAWYLSHRIRKAMGLVEAADEAPLDGTVEADETYIGGKYDKRRKRAKYHKQPVFGVVERDGRVRTCHMPKVTLQNIVAKIKDNVSINADAIFTDDSNLYIPVAGCIKSHKHESVDHHAKEWVRGDVHTGTIDGYWGLLKRGIIGSFHQVSIKHLARYLTEFQFKWNNRKHQEIFTLVMCALVIGSALPYADLIRALETEPDRGPLVELGGEEF